MDIFSSLSQEEVELLQEAPALVTILIGASDGKLDGEERTWSEKLLRARSYSGKKVLQDYYRLVSEGLWVELQHQMSILPAEVSARNEIIVHKLEGLNSILAKLDPSVGYALYKGLLGLADEVAKASGGFLRMGAVSSAEHAWVNLPMLEPIAATPDAENDADRFDENIWGEKEEA